MSLDSDFDAEDKSTSPSGKESKISTKKLSWNQYAEAALIVLRELQRPMNYKELTQIAIQKGLIQSTSQTPEASMNSTLSTHANKNIKFQRVGVGTYQLKSEGEKIKKEIEKKDKKPKSKPQKTNQMHTLNFTFN